MDAKTFSTAALLLICPLIAGAEPEKPPPSEADSCKSAYQAAYEPPYGLTHELWDSRCEDGVAAGDILELGRQKCRNDYDPKSDGPIGLTRETWNRDCDRGLDGKSEAQYLAEKKKLYVLAAPVERITIGQAYVFLALTKADASPAVVAKRRQLEARLARASEAWRKLSASVKKDQDFMSRPLAIGAVSTESQYRALMARFDRAGAADGELADAVVGGRTGSPRGADLRPARLRPPSMRRADRGIDDPEAIRERLLDRVRSLSARRDENGAPFYDEKVIRTLETIVTSVPIRSGSPPATDLVALEDARRTVETIDKNWTKIEFDPNLDTYGWTKTYRPDGKPRLKGDGYQKLVRIRPVSKEGGEYPLEVLAGVLIHEIAHVHVMAIRNAGANNLTNETYAFRAEFRYYSNLGQARAEGGRKDGFLDAGQASLLATFEADPDGFAYDLIEPYYGEGADKEMHPGVLTIAQQREEARKKKDSVMLALLARDEVLDRESRSADATWRASKRAQCEEFWRTDAEAKRVDEETSALETRKTDAAVKDGERVKIEARLKELEDARARLMESHAYCRVD